MEEIKDAKCCYPVRDKHIKACTRVEGTHTTKLDMEFKKFKLNNLISVVIN